MKKNLIIVSTLLIGMAFIIGILVNNRYGRSRGVQAGSAGEKGEGFRVPEKTLNSEIFEIEEKRGKAFSEQEKELKPPDFGWEAWAQFLDFFEQDISMNGPVEFYGKVVDTKGEPIPEVAVLARVDFHFESLSDKLTGGASGGSKKIDLVSNRDGLFSIRGEKGFGLMVYNLEKEGFVDVNERKQWGASFNPKVPHRHMPDVNEPIVFVMKAVEE